MKNRTKLLPFLICICLFSVFALGSGSSNSSSSEASKAGDVADAANASSDSISATSDNNAATSDNNAATSDNNAATSDNNAATSDNNAVSSDNGTDSSDNGSASVNKTPVAVEQTEFKVGETFAKDGLSLTYVSCSDWESDNQFIKPADGNKYIRLLFHADNQSKKNQSISFYSFNCYADGYECSMKYEDDSLSATVSSGRTADGAVYFEVPADAKEIEIEYAYNIISDKKVKFIFEGNKDSGLVFEKNISASENAFHVGDIIETEDLRITYLKAAEYKSDNKFSQPDEGMKYAYIELEIENLSDSNKSVSYISFDCYADGTNCDGYYGMDDLLSASLSAGRKAKGTIAFKVPVDASVVEFEFEDNIWNDSRIVFLYEE